MPTLVAIGTVEVDDFCLSRDLGRSHGQKVMDFVGKVSQVSHHPAHFGDDKRCNSGDITFLVVQEQDSTCALKSAILIFYFCRTRYVMLSHTIFQTVEMIIAMSCL